MKNKTIRFCSHCGDKMEFFILHPSSGQGLPEKINSYCCHKPKCQFEEYFLLCKEQGIKLDENTYLDNKTRFKTALR